MNELDVFFMTKALDQAQRAFAQDEVPIGCVIVKNGKIIARAHNQVEKKKNGTKHAEIICIEKAAKKIQNFRLLDCTIYTTVEPCLMCAGAIILSRIKKIVYAAKDHRHGALVSIYRVLENGHPIHAPQFEQGPMEKESSELLKLFFQKKRKKNDKF